MDEAAEPIPSEHADGRPGRWRVSPAGGRWSPAGKEGGNARGYVFGLVGDYGDAVSEPFDEGVVAFVEPGINMKRSPRCRRNFEYFSEDPFADDGVDGAPRRAPHPDRA